MKANSAEAMGKVSLWHYQNSTSTLSDTTGIIVSSPPTFLRLSLPDEAFRKLTFEDELKTFEEMEITRNNGRI